MMNSLLITVCSKSYIDSIIEIGQIQYILNTVMSSEESNIKEYINELFQQYDTQKKGALSFQQLSKFFEDLLKSVGIHVGYTYQQLYEVIYMTNPSFNGFATPDDVYKIFTTLLTYGQKSQTPSEQPQQLNQAQTNQYTAMQGQYMNPMYPYMQMGGQMGGQMWSYGMNPNWHRQ